MHTENHFDITPLCDAFQDYDTNFNVRSWVQRDAHLAKLIGKLQRLLPVHFLQRYCDPNTPFYLNGPHIFMIILLTLPHLFWVPLSSDFTLVPARAFEGGASRVWLTGRLGSVELAAIRQFDEVSTNETKNIMGNLSQRQHGAELRP